MPHLSLTTSSDYSSIVLLTRKFLQLSGYDCPFTAHLQPLNFPSLLMPKVPCATFNIHAPGRSSRVWIDIPREQKQSPLCQNPITAERLLSQGQGRKMRGSATGEAMTQSKANKESQSASALIPGQGDEKYLLNTLWFCGCLTQAQERPISVEICASII